MGDSSTDTDYGTIVVKIKEFIDFQNDIDLNENALTIEARLVKMLWHFPDNFDSADQDRLTHGERSLRLDYRLSQAR